MPLAPSIIDQDFASLEAILRAVNEHAGPEGYAVVIGRTKKSKLGVTRKVWIICDRGGKIREPTGQKRRHGSSRRTECPFTLTAILDNNIGLWVVEIVDPEHNH